MWELLLIQLLPIGVGVAALLPTLLKNRRRLSDLKDAASVCGLQILEISGWSPRLTARMGPMTVKMEASGDYTRIVLQGPVPPSLHTVSIRREPLLRRGTEIEIGDPAFDDTFFIEGPMQQVLSLLDAEMRGRMIRANSESRLQISNGMLLAENMSDNAVPFFLPLLVEIGQRLSQPMDVARRLADNAKGDPDSGVRLRNLRCLIRELPEAPETHEALRTACSDARPEIRLQAAKGLGSEGRGVLLDLAESLVDDAVSAEAVAALDRELSFERTKAILGHALDRSLPRTARACLEALGKRGVSPGQLSLAGAEAGQLSLTQADAGQLSLATDPAGQLSLPPDEPEQPPPEGRREPVGRPV